jgi:hypothetical protein
MILYHALSNLKSIAPSYNTPSSYIEFKDHEGWSDGYMADLTNINQDTMKLKAKIGFEKGKTSKFCVEKSECPRIKNVLDQASGNYKVDRFYFDINTLSIKLINHNTHAWVNPKFIKYFMVAYQTENLEFQLTDPLKPVKVLVNNTLIGLIMPIRHAC